MIDHPFPMDEVLPPLPNFEIPREMAFNFQNKGVGEWLKKLIYMNKN